MFEYRYGDKKSEKDQYYYQNKLIEIFAQEYDMQSNRMWNCLRKEPVCMEYDDIKQLKVPQSVIIYLERQNEVYSTNFKEVCKYVEELEPWEYIDAYVFDSTFEWLIAITHEELKCLVIGLEQIAP